MATKKVLNYAVSIAVAFLAFYGVKYVKEQWYARSAAESVESKAAEMKKRAEVERGDQPMSVKMAEIAQTEARKQVESATDASKARSAAAAQFWGFYWINMRTRTNWCKSRGVDISSFTKAFQKANEKAFVAASTLEPQDSAENKKLYEMLERTLLSATEQDMRDIMKQSGLGERDLCLLFASAKGSEIGAELSFATSFAPSYRALVGSP